MLHLQVSQPEKEPASCLVATFPFALGKAASSGLRLDAPGVWDSHATLRLQDRKFQIAAAGEAILLVNGELRADAVLKNGDVLNLGGCSILVTLSPTIQSRLTAREAATWVLVGLVLVVQVVALAILQ